MKRSIGPVWALAAVAALSCAGLHAPVAGAEEPCTTQECQSDPGGAGQVAGGVQQGVQIAGDVASKVYGHGNTSGPGWQTLLDGLPYCMHIGAQVKPGVVVSNPDPSGIAHPC